MPEISRFFGIIIRMYFNDHAPPHFHAFYGDDEVEIGIDPIVKLSGYLPPRALALAIEWAVQHDKELMDNWDRLHTDRQPQKISPLR